MPNIIKDKQTEQITGGTNDTEASKSIMHEEDEIITNIWRMTTCPNCGNVYYSNKPRTDGKCPKCEEILFMPNKDGINIISKDSLLNNKP